MNRIWLLIIALTIISLRFYFFYHSTSKYINSHDVKFETTLFSEPNTTYGNQKFLAYINGKDKVFVTAKNTPRLHYGDTIIISGRIKKVSLKNISSQQNNLLNPGSNNTILTISNPKIEFTQDNKSFILAIAYFVRQHIASLYEKYLPSTSAALLMGIVFGIKQNMSQQFTDALSASGVIHVIAASGMNVTMIGGFLSSIFVFFFRRQYALVLTILAILFYALMAGLGPSIVRASIMAILVFGAQIFGRQTLAIYSLLVAAFLMLFLNPILLSDVGFQLSFASTLGLIYLRPILAGRNLGLIEKSIVGEDVLTTISAQIATIPIIVANFGSYSLISILVNGILLWMVPILMVLGSVGAIFGFIFEPIAQVFIVATIPLLYFFEKVVLYFGSLKFGMLSLDYLPIQFAIAYYFFLFAFIYWRRGTNDK